MVKASNHTVAQGNAAHKQSLACKAQNEKAALMVKPLRERLVKHMLQLLRPLTNSLPKKRISITSECLPKWPG